MKNISIFALVVIAFLLGFASCEKDDYTGATSTSPTSPNATISEVPFPEYMMEQDTVFEYTITTDQPQIVDLVYRVETSAANTATEGEDFDFDHTVTIRAYETSGSGTITVYSDCTPEEDEVLALTIGAGGTAITPNNSFTPRDVSMTIGNDATASRLDGTFDWNRDIEINGVTYATCDSVDIDIYVFDDEGVDQELYAGATGACPELSFMDGLEDGVYYFAANLYWTGLPAYAEELADTVGIQITSSYYQCGVWEGLSFTQNTQYFTTADTAGIFVDVAKVTLDNGVYTVENIQ